MNRTRRNIWIDCDPGIDDAAAIALAAAHPGELRIVGISSVAGNQTIETTTANALKLCEILGLEGVPVVKGAQGPLLREPYIVPGIHGEDGLGDCGMQSEGRKKISADGIKGIYEGIMSLPEGEKLTLVATGPFTNVALLLRAFPEVKSKIEQIVFMGGGTFGNVSAMAEFNVWEDPEAASIMFREGLPMVMCGLDVTDFCYIGSQEIDALLTASEGSVQRMYGRMFDFYRHAPSYLENGAPHIHDAVCIAYLLHPEYFHGSEIYVEVDCSENTNRGMTICDRRNVCAKKANILMLERADSAAFLALLLEALRWHDGRR